MNNLKIPKTLSQKQALRIFCRFLSLRYSYYTLLILMSGTGIVLSLTGRTFFAPYGIALVCLLLPSFLNGSANEHTKKENRDLPFSSLFRRYHYSPVLFSSYRISLLLGMFLLFVWHIIQAPALTLCGISLPLLYLAFFLALSPVLAYIIFLVFHQRLMDGTL